MNQETITQIVKAREAGEFTDYVIVCEGQRLPVHKIIICTQSPVLHTACTGPYKEAFGEYHMDDHPLFLVRRLIDYLYTGKYKEQITEPGVDDLTDGGISPLQLHARMFALADKYDIKGLQALSAANYENAEHLEPNICNFIRSLSDIYTLTPESSRGLRDKAVALARKRLLSLLSSTEARGVYDKLVADTPEFARDLLESFFENPLVGGCPKCGHGEDVPAEVQKRTCTCRCKRCRRCDGLCDDPHVWFGMR